MIPARRLAASLSFLVVVGGAAHAAPTTDPTAGFDAELGAILVDGGLTAAQAAARARGASPQVARKLAEVDAAIAGTRAAELARVPHLEATLAYTRLSAVDPIELAPGVTLPVFLDSYDARSQLVVPLSDYLLRLPHAIDAARLGERAARAGERAAELDAATQARVAYYEWVRARLQVLVAERQVEQVRATLDQVRILVAGDRLSRADLLRIESQEAEAEQTLDGLRTLATLREEALRLRIGARSDEHLTIGEDVRAAVAVPRTAWLDDEMHRASSQRLDLRAVDLAIQASDARRRAERAGVLPRLSAFASATYADPNERVFPPADEFELTWAAGAQLSWSLDGALQAHQASRRAAAETRALRADRDQLGQAARLQVMAAQQDVGNAQRALATSQKRLDAAEEGYRVRRAFLDAQRGTAVELVDAETDLTRARIAALDARIDLRIALAELHHALGDDAR